MEVRWIKLSVDMFDNKKVKALRKLPDGDRIVLIWVMLLTMAGRCNANGMIFLTENIPYTPKMLADELSMEEGTVNLALEALKRFDMISVDDATEYIMVTGWQEHQNAEKMNEIREYNRLAKQRSRAKALCQGQVNDNVNDMSRTCQECQGTEEEREKEREDSSSSSIARGDEKILERRSLHPFGDGGAMLSDDQIEDLTERLTTEEFDHYVSVIEECIAKGKPFKRKSHYQAILDMAVKDRKVAK